MIPCSCCGVPVPSDPPNADPLDLDIALRFGICDACAEKARLPHETGIEWARARIGVYPELCR